MHFEMLISICPHTKFLHSFWPYFFGRVLLCPRDRLTVPRDVLHVLTPLPTLPTPPTHLPSGNRPFVFCICESILTCISWDYLQRKKKGKWYLIGRAIATWLKQVVWCLISKLTSPAKIHTYNLCSKETETGSSCHGSEGKGPNNVSVGMWVK